jgi:hypothetical protein
MATNPDFQSRLTFPTSETHHAATFIASVLRLLSVALRHGSLLKYQIGEHPIYDIMIDAII